MEDHPLELLLENTGNSVVRARQLRQLVECVRNVRDRLDTRLDRLEALVESADVLRVTVVATVNELPASAGVRQWYRVVGDPSVYVGNGAGQPLRKLTTVAL